MALTEKQKRFISEYLLDLNATQAAIRAGYSKKTAEVIGYENLRKPYISKEIQKAIGNRNERTGLNQDYIVNKLKEIVEQKASDRTESNLKYSNKIRALELLGKHLGMFDGNTSQEKTANQVESHNDLVNAIRGRSNED